MDIPEKTLKEKTKTELIRIIYEMMSERDAVKKDILRYQTEIAELQWMLDGLRK